MNSNKCYTQMYIVKICCTIHIWIFVLLGSERYRETGFLALQFAIDTSFIETITGTNDLPNIAFQEFPYPPHTVDIGASDLFTYYLPFITVFSFILLCPAVVKRVVEEKFSGIKVIFSFVLHKLTEGFFVILSVFGTLNFLSSIDGYV